MYIEHLNDRALNQFREFVADKKVLLVGNATSMFSEKLGPLVDSYDVVLRFGKGVPYPEYAEFLGRRTDVWFFGTARAGMYKDFRNVKFRIHTIAQQAMYKDSKPDMVVPRVCLTGELVPYQDFFLAGNMQRTLKRHLDINGPNPGGARLSQGAECVHFFVNDVRTQSELHLVGFDFFGSGFKYNYEDKKGKIPKVQTTTSWHCPLAAEDNQENPHLQHIDDSGQGAEQRYIMSQAGVFVRQMQPCDVEQMEKVMKRLRGDKTTKLIGAL